MVPVGNSLAKGSLKQLKRRIKRTKTMNKLRKKRKQRKRNLLLNKQLYDFSSPYRKE